MLQIGDQGMDIALMCSELDKHRWYKGGTVNGIKFRIFFGGAE
jgi:hypothetical protein